VAITNGQVEEIAASMFPQIQAGIQVFASDTIGPFRDELEKLGADKAQQILIIAGFVGALVGVVLDELFEPEEQE